MSDFLGILAAFIIVFATVYATYWFARLIEFHERRRK